jgi:DNA-binding beta-propeller fold protein YncE
MRGYLRFLAIVAIFGMAGATAQALTLYADSAGSNRIDLIDPNTGTLIRSCSPAKGNGRGMVVVSNIAYFTVADSNNVYKIDINTCADLGIAFSVTGATGLSTIAFDGTNFWIGDYSGTNHAFYYTPTGTLIKTITLSMCTSFCDGLEFFNGKLISNRGDDINAPYDVYDTNGAVLQAAFITPNFNATGIAFDGTNFYISNPLGGKVGVFNGTTGALINTLTLNGGSGFLIEDLSFDYQQVLPTPTPGGPTPTAIASTPTPTTSAPPAVVPTLGFPMLALFGAALLGAALLLMRR